LVYSQRGDGAKASATGRKISISLRRGGGRGLSISRGAFHTRGVDVRGVYTIDERDRLTGLICAGMMDGAGLDGPVSVGLRLGMQDVRGPDFRSRETARRPNPALAS
jgi:hypothetical protein